MRTLSWFSCGTASAVATRLIFKENPYSLIVYCDTGSEHPDNKRFFDDCLEWFGLKENGKDAYADSCRDVYILKNEKYKDVDDVIEKTKYMSGISGARCTVELKKVPRFNFQKPDDLHIFGYTLEEKKRAERFQENNPELNLRFPLIEKQITKKDTLALINEAGIELPIMYKQGFEHNNCIGCVKASGKDYWARIRQYYPEVFKKRCEQSRELGVRLIWINGVRSFLDELPVYKTFEYEPEPICDFLCQDIHASI